jgi:hypothetical protein
MTAGDNALDTLRKLGSNLNHFKIFVWPSSVKRDAGKGVLQGLRVAGFQGCIRAAHSAASQLVNTHRLSVADLLSDYSKKLKNLR